MSSKNRLLSKLISNTGKVKEASLSATDIASTISKSSVTIDTFKDVDLTVQPEVLEIQVDDPTAGHTGTWLWTWPNCKNSLCPNYALNKISNTSWAK